MTDKRVRLINKGRRLINAWQLSFVIVGLTGQRSIKRYK